MGGDRVRLFVVWATGQHNACWECSGGGDAEVWQVYAATPKEALRLVADSLKLEPYDDPVDLHVLDVMPSKARRARVIPESQWAADGSFFIDPPSWGGR